MAHPWGLSLIHIFAGITGSGQRELLEAVAGLQTLQPGSSIQLIPPDGAPTELTGKDPLEIYKLGVGLALDVYKRQRWGRCPGSPRW